MDSLKNTLHNGDCLDVLRTIPDSSVDSCVSDVPYGLGSKEPTPDEILAYLQGAVLKTGDFMGADWDIPSVEVWKEVYRVLKPGAYLISFGGTRTFDLISLGIRMAGFECRDTIFNETTEECVSAELPTLQWLYGSGMPKSHNVGKAIDKAQGLEREVVGHYQLPPDHARPNKNMEQWFQRQSEADDRRINYSKGMGNGKREITAPASEDASKWEGWGSGLKPACEPILLFRKPFKGTLVNNVLTHGTGALNINATRVKHANAADFEAHKAQVEAVRNRGGVRGNSWKNASDLSGANEVTADGRWPANLLLTHVQYVQYWKLRSNTPSEIKQEILAHYGAKQALFTLWHSVLGDAFRVEEAEVLFTELCRPVQKITSENRVVANDLFTMLDPVRGASSMGEERASEVLLKGLPESIQSREQEPSGGSPHRCLLGEDARCSYWEVLERELLSMEGGSLSVSPGVCLRYGEYLAGDIDGFRISDGESGQEVHCGTQSGSSSKIRSSSVEGRSGSSHKWCQNRQFFGKSRSGSSECSQSGSSGDRTESRSVRNTVGSLAGGELDFEVEISYLRVDHRSWFELSRSTGCYRTNDGWQCHPGCPVKALDQQSGDRPSTLTGRADPNVAHNHPGTEMNPNSTFLGERTHLSNVYADSGGASRFFSQFDGVPFRYIPKANRKEAGCGVFEVQHPTVKPIALMRWLVKLVTPKAGIVLDPYCGSGSTLHAALLEGCSYLGIERDETNYAEAKRRMDIVQAEQENQDVFNELMGIE